MRYNTKHKGNNLGHMTTCGEKAKTPRKLEEKSGPNWHFQNRVSAISGNSVAVLTFKVDFRISVHFPSEVGYLSKLQLCNFCAAWILYFALFNFTIFPASYACCVVPFWSVVSIYVCTSLAESASDFVVLVAMLCLFSLVLSKSTHSIMTTIRMVLQWK